jgi:hypothetical protein
LKGCGFDALFVEDAFEVRDRLSSVVGRVGGVETEIILKVRQSFPVRALQSNGGASAGYAATAATRKPTVRNASVTVDTVNNQLEDRCPDGA